MFQNSFLIKKNAAISILIEIFAHLLIIFAHHCKIKIIPHNLCTILLQDKLRVCVFKAFDSQSTNYLLKGWVNFHPHKKNMKMTVSRVTLETFKRSLDDHLSGMPSGALALLDVAPEDP